LNRKPGLIGAIQNLFSNDYKSVEAVNDISFAIAQGEVVGYIGPNGAGKSTTIKMLTGILHPTAGEVLVDGFVPQRERVRNSMQIGVVFGQRSQLLWDIPPRDTFELMRKMYTIPRERYARNLTHFIELLEMGDFLDRPVRQLSLGQRMRCELVASLLHDPKVLYLDEPTIGLDVVAKERIREFIQSLNQERQTTVILTTHDIDDIERLCRRVLIIDKGKLIYDGALAEIKRRFGRRRQLTFSLAEGAPAAGLDAAIGAIGSGIDVQRDDDGAIHVGFDPQLVDATTLTRHIVNSYPVSDLAVAEADLEAIIRAIYQRGHTNDA
ncbi:MAG TPA: ATP-binding cassette domain-containing protein, partial [Caldilineaceae bacterium]|nr:ATP-binding cassette domain-containing protein [Caldilineaceae bacterium]